MLKIAAGVFLAIIAVLVVVKYPDWMKDAVENHNEFVLLEMTPEKLVAKCGKPLSDKQTKQSPYTYREIEYQGRLDKVTFNFFRGKNTPWVRAGGKIGQEIIVWDKNGSSRVIFEMPCMDKKD
jgi:hypothetical protein